MMDAIADRIHKRPIVSAEIADRVDNKLFRRMDS